MRGFTKYDRHFERLTLAGKERPRSVLMSPIMWTFLGRDHGIVPYYGAREDICAHGASPFYKDNTLFIWSAILAAAEGAKKCDLASGARGKVFASVRGTYTGNDTPQKPEYVDLDDSFVYGKDEIGNAWPLEDTAE